MKKIDKFWTIVLAIIGVGLILLAAVTVGLIISQTLTYRGITLDTRGLVFDTAPGTQSVIAWVETLRWIVAPNVIGLVILKVTIPVMETWKKDKTEEEVALA